EEGFRFKQISCFKIVQNKLIIGTDEGYCEWDIPSLVRAKESDLHLSLNQPYSSKSVLPILKFPYDKENIELKFNYACLFHPQKIKFEDAFPNKLLVDVNGIELKYIGLKEFIVNKTASGRSQDIADLKEIKNIKKQ
ncbi:MAG: hypothetical protein RL037_2299, partial [Bacteroidota bacterium]